MGLTRAERSDPFAQERNGPTRGVEVRLKVPVVFCQLMPSAQIPKERDGLWLGVGPTPFEFAFCRPSEGFAKYPSVIICTPYVSFEIFI